MSALLLKMSKKLSLILFILLTLLALSALFISIGLVKPFSPQGKIYEVVLTESGFIPKDITIDHGDSIKFSTTLKEPFWPASDLHPTHGIYPEFDPQEPIEPDKSWTFQFLKSGRWRFHDHLQPILRGTIVVQ